MFRSIVFLLFISISAILTAQEEDNEVDKFSSFAIGSDFSTNKNLNGLVNMFSSQPSLSLYSSYYHKSGFDFTFLFSTVGNSDESNTKATQEYGLLFGYNYDVFKWLNLSASYSHYFYSSNSYSIGSSFNNAFNLGLYGNVKSFTASFDAGHYLGKSNKIFTSLDLCYAFEFENVFAKDNSLSIEPSFTIYTDDLDYYNEQAYIDYYFLYNYSERRPDVTVGQLLYWIENPETILDRYVQRLVEERPFLIRKIQQLPTDLVISDLFKEQHKYGISSIGISLPVYYQWGDFQINVGFTVYKPVNQPNYFDDSWDSFANVGITYLISWE